MKKSYENDVLFQKLGNSWYAFTKNEHGEVIFTALPKGLDAQKVELLEVLEEKRSAKAKKGKRAPDLENAA